MAGKYRPSKWKGIEKDPSRPCLYCERKVGGKYWRQGVARVFCSNKCKLAYYYVLVTRPKRDRERAAKLRRTA